MATIGDQLYQPEGSPDDFQRSLEAETRRKPRYRIGAYVLLTRPRWGYQECVRNDLTGAGLCHGLRTELGIGRPATIIEASSNRYLLHSWCGYWLWVDADDIEPHPTPSNLQS